MLALSLLAFAAAPLPAATATLVADAHVNRALPDTNSGTLSNLAVGAGYTALLQFDFGILPAGTTAAQVSRATLRLYVNRADTPGLVQVQTVGAAWGEYSVTYASQPALVASAGQIAVGQAGTYVTMDATALVRAWLSAPASNFGIALSATTAAVQFDSKENELTGHAPELEMVLVSSGGVGAQGPAGPQGPAGATGPAGAQGPAGPAGPQGATGPAGATGPQGAQGPAGGLSYQGSYSAATTYAVGAVVNFGGSSWASLISPNRNNAPSTTSVAWGLLAQAQPGATGPAGAQGPTGASGPQGLTGPAGPAGPQGATGPAGPQGPAMARFTGAYSPATSYALNDAASYNGSTYISLMTSNRGNTPDASPAQWVVLAGKGDTGAQGPAGAQGPTGPVGATGPQGAAGAAGAVGARGPAGAVGINFRGGWNSAINYVTNDAVTYNGSTYLAQASNSALAPDTSATAWAVLATAGAVGPSGPTGGAATVTIGNVTTGAAGTAAAVSNSGTASAAVLNFTIPQGVPGASGGSGGSGPGAAASVTGVYHSVSYSANFFSVANGNASLSETDGTVLTWVPNGCTATKLQVFSRQGNSITVTLRAGSPGSMTPLMSCQAATANSCSALGSGTVAAGQFIDLQIAGANGTAAPVWTLLTCE